MSQSNPSSRPSPSEDAKLYKAIADRFISIGEDAIVTVVCLGLATSMVVKPLNRVIHGALYMPEAVASTATSSFDRLTGNAKRPVKVGDFVAGHEVTSPFGERIHPIYQTKIQHDGVDLATPEGTPLYAPVPHKETVEVRCWEDSSGGGLVADVVKNDGSKVQFLHLRSCNEGEVKGGLLVAKTGNSGESTGPHLDIRVKDSEGVPESPPVGIIWWSLTGKSP